MNPGLIHPDDALFGDEHPPPSLPACEHYAGTPKLMEKALSLQQQMGPLFDVTCDCEDGAPTGREREHAATIADLLSSPANRFKRVGVRIHDYTHPCWQSDLDILVGRCGQLLSHITLPKSSSVEQVEEMVDYIRQWEARLSVARPVPVHVLIESQAGLRDVWRIAALERVRVIDFGLMDFISDHRGAIPARCMRSPGQFKHQLIIRAKCEIVAAALAHGCIPSHNVTLDLKDANATYNDALRARNEYGFLRMWSIHPTQIQPILEAMRPDFSDVTLGSAILLKAQQNRWGPIQYQGELHDRASYRYYWQILKEASATGVPLPPEAQSAFFPERMNSKE